MELSLHNLSPKKKKTKKRIGRGLGSGSGAKSGRGQKGQKSRSGVSGLKRLGMRRMMLATPKKRGFKATKEQKAVVNLSDLDANFNAQAVVTPSALRQKKLISSVKLGVKILGQGTLTKALTIKGCSVSKAAAEKILAAGGSVHAEA